MDTNVSGAVSPFDAPELGPWLRPSGWGLGHPLRVSLGPGRPAGDPAQRLTERTRASRQKLRETGRWSGGTVPYGYKAVQRDSGWYFEPDDPKASLVREIVRRVTAHESVISISSDLNERGVPSPRGKQWGATAITRMLRSRSIIGQVEHKGRPVLDDDGLQVHVPTAVLEQQFPGVRTADEREAEQARFRREFGIE